MQVNTMIIGAGVAVAIAAGLGYALLSHHEDELEFDTIVRDGAFSVRAYPQLVVAETVELGTRESALARGFATLADFLGGISRDPLKIPVLADGDEDGRGWRTRLALPAKLRGVELPEPEGVTIRTLAPRRLAALRFTGEADDSALSRHETGLRYWMETQGLRPAGAVEHAFYSAPLMPAPFRRNEILIPLAA
jgi:hypothetical protein